MLLHRPWGTPPTLYALTVGFTSAAASSAMTSTTAGTTTELIIVVPIAGCAADISLGIVAYSSTCFRMRLCAKGGRRRLSKTD